MKNKKLVASVAAVMLLATGTFAWQSFSQLATNEVIETVDTPGGRLHDYFNGEDKDVFVENYATGDNAPNVYARIRLSEYLEYGKDAGSDTANTDNITLVRGDIQDGTPILGEPDTWDVYDYEATVEGTSGDIRTYRDLELGGTSVFMPTFNQDNTNLDPDVRGTYRDDAGNVKADPYDDYASYDVDDTESGTLVTADDTVGTAASHTAKATGDATIMTMSDWVDAGAPVGDYWVFDTTGWAYYAQAITPGEASGLLLDGITVESNPKQEWYYAVDVKAQLATAGDWGDKESSEGADDGTGMYEDLTPNAQGLLNKISGIMQATNMEITDGNGNPLEASNLQISYADTLSLDVSMDVVNGTGAASEKEVVWTVTEVDNTEAVARTTSNGSGLSQEALNATVTVTESGVVFTPVEDMAGYYYDITATSTMASADAVSIRVFVYDPSATIEVSVAGDVSDLKVETSLQANAYYAGSSVSAPVTWAVTETTGDSGLDTAGLNATISDSGLFTPVESMAGGTYTLTASTTGTPTLSDSVVINVYTTGSSDGNNTDNGDGSTGDGTGGEDSTVTVTVSSTDDTLNIGSSLSLSAVVTGLSDDSVTWVIAKKSGTSSLTPEEVSATISETGTFTPVSGMSGCTYTIKAISTVDGAFWDSKDIAINIPTLTVKSADDAVTVDQGDTLEFSVDTTNLPEDTVTWSITTTGLATGTSIDSDGVLTIGAAEEENKAITVKATSTIDTNLSNTKSIVVTSADYMTSLGKMESEILAIAAEKGNVTVDGLAWQVLKVEDGAALLYATGLVGPNTAFHGTSSDDRDSTWSTSDMRTYLNSDAYINAYFPSIKASLKSTTLETALVTNASGNYETTTDKVFLLTQEDLGWTTDASTGSTSYPTVSGALVPSGDVNIGSYFWLRSPLSSIYVRSVSSTGALRNNYSSTTAYGVRPALWVDL